MLVAKYLHDLYVEMKKSFTDEGSFGLDSQMDLLVTWGMRNGPSLTFVDEEIRKIVRVFDIDGRPIECIINREESDLESANKTVLKELDAIIIDVFKKLKVLKFERPSVVSLGRFVEFIHRREMDDVWQKNRSGFLGAHLIWKRLNSTARLAARYEFPERFGPRCIFDENDKIIEMRYGKRPWIGLMVARGMLGKRRG